MTEEPLATTDYVTLAEFRYRLRLFMRFSEEEAARRGLTPQQYQALLTIRGWPGEHSPSVGELAGHLLIRHHSAVGLVDRLCALGLVRREAVMDDRRQVRLHLTDEGSRLLETLASIHREQLRRLGPTLRALLERFAPPDE